MPPDSVVATPKVRRTPEELALRGTRSRIEGTFYLLAFLMVGLAASFGLVASLR